MGVLENVPRIAEVQLVQAVTAVASEKLQSVKEKTTQLLSSAVTYVEWSLPRNSPEYNRSCNDALAYFNEGKVRTDSAPLTFISIGDFIRAAYVPVQKNMYENGSGMAISGLGELSVEVMINPSEIGRLHQACTVLRYLADSNLNRIHELLQYQEKNYSEPSDVIALRLLSVMDRLGYINSRFYQNLIAFLREHVLEKGKIKSWEQLDKKYWGRIIADRGFWQPSFRPVLVDMPDQSDRIRKTRESTQHKQQVESRTIVSTLKQTKVFKDTTAVGAYRSKAHDLVVVRQEQLRIMMERVSAWRTAWNPLVEQIFFDGKAAFNDPEIGETEELEYEVNRFSKLLFEIVQLFFDSEEVSDQQSEETLLGHTRDEKIMQRSAERQLSRKAARSFAGESLKSDAVFDAQIDKFILNAFAKRDPAIMWLYGLRTPVFRQKIIQSIEQQPEAFEEFAKLVVHELSQSGLVRRHGEVNLFFESDQQASKRFRERLPKFIEKAKEWGKIHSQFAKKTSSSETFKTRNSTKDLVFLKQAKIDLDLLFQLDRRNLARQRQSACMEQIDLFVPHQSKRMAEVLARLRLRSAQVFDRAFGSQIRKLRPDYMWKGITHALRPEKEIPSEYKNRFAVRVGEVLASSRQLENFESLPFIAEEIDGGSGREYMEKPTELTPLSTLKTLAELRDSVEEDEDIAVAFSTIEPLAMYGYEEFDISQLDKVRVLENDGSETEKILVKAKAKKHIVPGICKSGLHAESEYRLDEVIKLESALLFNANLVGYPKLQKLHRTAIETLKGAINLNKKEQAKVITQIAQALVQFLQSNHFYDHPDPKPTRGHALEWLVENQQHGFECLTSAWVIEDFFNSLGVPCVVVTGHVPYYYQGGAYYNQSNGHAIISMPLPGGEVIDIDASLYITAATPPWVSNYQKPTPPETEEGEAVAVRLTEGSIETFFMRKEQSQKSKISSLVKTAVTVAMVGGAYSLFGGGARDNLSGKEFGGLDFPFKEWWAALEMYINSLDFGQQTASPESGWPQAIQAVIDQLKVTLDQAATQTVRWYQAHKSIMQSSVVGVGSVGTGFYVLRSLLRAKSVTEQTKVEDTENKDQVAGISTTDKNEPTEVERLIELAMTLQHILPEAAAELQKLVTVDWEQIKPLVQLLINLEQLGILEVRQFDWENQQLVAEQLAKLRKQEQWISFAANRHQTLNQQFLEFMSTLPSDNSHGNSVIPAEVLTHLCQVGTALRSVCSLQDTLHEYESQKLILEYLSANQHHDSKPTQLTVLGALASAQLQFIESKTRSLSQIVDNIVGSMIITESTAVPSK